MNATKKNHLKHLEIDCVFFPQTIHFAQSFTPLPKLITSFKQETFPTTFTVLIK